MYMHVESSFCNTPCCNICLSKHHYHHRNDILCDANSACRTALDILNDLLCFDKLESGILVLHKHEVPVMSFIFDCVAMFSSQARECDVNLSLIDINPPVHSDSTLLHTDTAFIDKFKMDQVRFI
jgi:signal transduction histidine kinase